MKKAVNFLTVKSIAVSNFDLYPEGLQHSFENGINVAIGINGIGKTTLLRAIYRAISGPADIRDNVELGEGQRKYFVLPNPSSLFGPVAKDGAERATIEIKLQIGLAYVEITRSLKNLKLMSFKKDGIDVLTNDLDNEEQYRSILPQLMSVPSFFDVLLVLRYVMFTLEDRRSIVWDSEAQVELLQIFLYPTEDQKAYRTAFNEAMKADSAARNYQSLLTKEERNYRSKAAKIPTIESVTQLEEAILSLRPQVNELEATVERLDEERKAVRSRKLRLEEDLLQHDLAEESLREKHLADLLPELNDYGAYIVSRLEHGSCLICGSTDTEAVSAIAKLLVHEHKCPLCTTTVNDSATLAESEYHSLEELSEARRKAEEQRTSVLQQEEQVRSEFSTAYKQWVEKDDELSRLVSRQRVLAASLGTNPSELLGQHKVVRQTLETQRDHYKKEKDAAILKLKNIANEHLEQIKEFCEKMSQSFNQLIAALLAEECILTWSINEKHIGQGTSEITVPMPTFLIRMTSGVFTGTPAPRYRPTDVSESQRELIDLAFRLSLIRVFARNEAASLMTETPDDGLDVAFIPNYAKVMRDAATVNNPGSTFLVTANLNGSPLIKMLLSGEESGKQEDGVDRNNYVIDLLHKSARTAAIQKYGLRYESALVEAIGVKS